MRHIPEYRINSIPNNKQDYNTVGDYGYLSRNSYWIRVSRFSTPIYELALACHEMIEWTLCQIAGISNRTILAWDKSHPDEDNPGTLKGCPYRKQHMIAEAAERLIVRLCGGSWKEYGEECTNLFNNYKK